MEVNKQRFELLEKIKLKAGNNSWLPKIQIRWSENYNDFIWSHDFAKAFWGEEEYCCRCCYSRRMGDAPGIGSYCLDCGVDCILLSWEYHLQQMVLCEEPLRYLEKFL